MIAALLVLGILVFLGWLVIKATGAVGREVKGNAQAVRYIRETHRTQPQPAKSTFTKAELDYYRAHAVKGH